MQGSPPLKRTWSLIWRFAAFGALGLLGGVLEPGTNGSLSLRVLSSRIGALWLRSPIA